MKRSVQPHPTWHCYKNSYNSSNNQSNQWNPKGKNYTWGILTTLKTIKNQLSEPYSITREGEVIVTPHGLIGVDKDTIDEYKRVHMSKIIKELQELTGDSSLTEKDIEYTEEDAED